MKKAISKFLETPVSSESVRALFRVFHHQTFVPTSFDVVQLPYYHFQHQMKDMGGDQIATKIESYLEHHESLNWDDKIRAAAVGLRADNLSEKTLEFLLETPVVQILRSINKRSKLELIFFYCYFRQFPKATRVCQNLRMKHMLEDHEKLIVSDFEVVLTYRHWRKRLPGNNFPIDKFSNVVDAAIDLIGKETKNAIYYKALVASVKGEDAAALSLYNGASELNGTITNVLEPSKVLYQLPEDHKDVIPSTISRFETKMTIEYRHDSKDEYAVLLTCDERYFKNFITVFLTSVGFHQENAVVHLHCVSFRPCENELNALEQEHNVRLNLTVDHALETDEAKHVLLGGYCVVGRFMWMPKYLEHYGAVFVSDIDGIMLRPIARIVEDNDKDVRLASRSYFEEGKSCKRAFWDRVSGGLVMMKANEGGLCYARTVANHLWYRFSKVLRGKANLFFADQTVLAMAYLEAKEKCDFGPIGICFTQGGGLLDSNRFGIKKQAQTENMKKLIEEAEKKSANSDP